jgi:hypothetical protein
VRQTRKARETARKIVREKIAMKAGMVEIVALGKRSS